MSDISKVLSAFNGVKKTGTDQWKAICPAHADEKASLSIAYRAKEDKILIHCFAGCGFGEIVSAAGLEVSDFQPVKELPKWRQEWTTEYRYYNESGEYLYSKVRKETSEGKEIRYAKVHGDSIEIKSGIVMPEKKILYNLPNTINAIKSGKTIFIVEGEKDVETLNKHGFVATTAGGANDWRNVKEKSIRYFIGADVILLPDNDEPGQELMEEISRDLRGVAFCRRTITTSRRSKGDITDWFEEGHGVDELLALMRDAEVQYAPWATKKKINVGLLADEVLLRNHFIVAHDPAKGGEIVFLYKDGFYNQMSDSEIVSIVTPYIPKEIQRPETLTSVLKLVKYNAKKVDFDNLNIQEDKVNLRNGLLDIKMMELTPHSRSILTTTQLACNYNRDAKCPRWLKFMDEFCNDGNGGVDVEMRDILQEWAGLILSPVHGYRVKKALVLNSPEGNTGKSVFIGAIRNIVGKNGFATISFQEMGSSRWATSHAFGKRLIINGDQSAAAIESSSVFKSMTGGDYVSAEFKGMSPFDYRFTGTMMLACNVLPVFNDDKGNHVADRLCFINCRNVLPVDKRDPMLPDDLAKESDGIFLWAMEGLKRLVGNRMKFSTCESSEALMDEYRARFDTLYSFVKDECIRENNAVIRKAEFETAYNNYCISQEVTPLNRKNISVRAASLGIKLSTLDGNKVYRGIRLSRFDERGDETPDGFIASNNPIPF